MAHALEHAGNPSDDIVHECDICGEADNAYIPTVFPYFLTPHDYAEFLGSEVLTPASCPHGYVHAKCLKGLDREQRYRQGMLYVPDVPGGIETLPSGGMRSKADPSFMQRIAYKVGKSHNFNFTNRTSVVIVLIVSDDPDRLRLVSKEVSVGGRVGAELPGVAADVNAEVKYEFKARPGSDGGGLQTFRLVPKQSVSLSSKVRCSRMSHTADHATVSDDPLDYLFLRSLCESLETGSIQRP